jgi:hypothetical protein
LIPGARADHWTLTDQTTTSPWVQGEWQLPHSMFIRGGTGIYRQFPDFEQVIGAFGLTDAGSQRAEQYDLGFEQRIGTSIRWQGDESSIAKKKGSFAGREPKRASSTAGWFAGS